MKYCILVLITAACCSCSRTHYSVSPSFGYDLQDSSRLIIAKFQYAPNDLISEQATEALKSVYQTCTNVVVIPYDTVQNIFYKNVTYTNPIWEVDTEFLVKLYESTKARYLLVGKVSDGSQSRPPVSIAESYGTGQTEDIQKNWIMLEFTLYDLTTSQPALEVYTRTKAGQYNRTRDDGSVVSYHAPIDIFDKAFEKSMDKLAKVCQCKK